ncbi:MAG: hypothetical protein JRM73_01970 [Nitrososphaerota archaeon]|nr:hypothetical protein [Nitrososphaerota archaeon]
MPTATAAELVFVVDVSSLTKKGFVGSSTYQGKRVDFSFDDGADGVYLTPQMTARMHVRKGSKVMVALEDGAALFVELSVAGTSKAPRISDQRVYYAIGHEGGAILRIRKS